MPRDEKEIAKDRNKVRALVGDIHLPTSLSREEQLNKIKQSFLQKGALNQQAALNHIYPKEPTDIMPVIIKVLEDLLVAVKARKTPSLPTETFLTQALAKMRDVDKKQNLGPLQKAEILGELTKNKIKEQMQPLLNGIAEAVIIEEELLLWYEAVLWLEGSYLHVHNAALKYFGGKLKYEKNDPEIVSDYDWEDTALKKLTGVTKHFIQEFFHSFAEKLETRIKQSLLPKSLEQSGVKKIVEMSPRIEAFSHSINSISDSDHTLIINLKGCTRQQAEEMFRKFNFFASEDPLAKSVKFEDDNIARSKLMVSECRKDRLIDVLNQGQSLRAELLFTLIVSGLKECVLTGREDDIFRTYVGDIKAKLTSKYINNAWTGILPTRAFFARSHTKEVNEAIEKMETRTTALDIMQDLHGLWVLAVSETSSTLKPVLEEIGLDLYSLLRTKLAAISEAQNMSLSLKAGNQ